MDAAGSSGPDFQPSSPRAERQTRLNGAAGSSGPDFQPGLNEKEIFQDMKTQVGKSVGIALLLAAGLLAALFAMGVFSASSVGADDGS